VLKLNKIVHQSGKRKSAVARATVKEGTGKITINGVAIDSFEPVMYRMRILEPIYLAGDVASTVDIIVTVNGGGVNGQADAIRLSIARALAEHAPKLKNAFQEYDRMLLVADIRRKESRKPNTHGKARSKKQKSYR
jgi:small subunit ribosomal protein S9